MSLRGTCWPCITAVICALVAVVLLANPSSSDEGGATPDAPLERTRKTVRMLDDVYKAVVVLITDKYVEDEDDFPAGSAAIALFQAVKDKKWHEVKLLDVTGEPYNDENVAGDDFEKAAVGPIKAGEAYFDRVEERADGRYLRAATPLPVVLKKCIMCHEHYEDAQPGEAIGMLSYTLKIE